ncbi:hypothetical protein Q8A64_10720, partial [Oxalobacteraceae bacterium R-40]|nr:hypothetical protein [Oxalobacteraceae bacterium R-40]
VDSVKRVTDIMAEITAASNEQSAGIEQVNQAIAQMDQVTQQNAALVEQAAAAAESMQHQSSQLTNVVSVFKLNGMHASFSAPTIPRMKPKAGPANQSSRSTKPAAVSNAKAPKQAVAMTAGNADEWEEF